WIPYENIEIEEQGKMIGDGGFGTIYKALWKEGPISGISANETKFKRTKGIQVVLKSLKRGDIQEYLKEETKGHKDTSEGSEHELVQIFPKLLILKFKEIDNADKLRNIQKVESHTGSELSINIHQNSEANTESTMSSIENKNIQEVKSCSDSELSIKIHDLNTESIMFVIENNV
ncbi:1025_t:CDS:2, partial [Gigaspora rosea]